MFGPVIDRRFTMKKRNWAICNNLHFAERITLKDKKIVIPTAMKFLILKQFHITPQNKKN